MEGTRDVNARERKAIDAAWEKYMKELRKKGTAADLTRSWEEYQKKLSELGVVVVSGSYYVKT